MELTKLTLGLYQTNWESVPRLIRGPISLIQNSFANTPMQYR